MRDLFAVANRLVKPGSPGGVGLALRPPWRLFVLTELQKNYSTVFFFAENSVERWYMGRGRNRQLLMASVSHYVRVRVRLGHRVRLGDGHGHC